MRTGSPRTRQHRTRIRVIPNGARIAELRKQRNLTQAELGEALGGVEQPHISDLEAGRKPVQLVRIRHLALFFGDGTKDTDLYTEVVPAAGSGDLAQTG